MLVLVATLAWAVPPDTLAGATIGALLVRSDYTSCDASSCWVKASLAGISGRRTVVGCNGTISTIVWMSDEVGTPTLLTAWVHTLLDPLATAGWTYEPGETKVHTDATFGKVVDKSMHLNAPDGRYRQLSILTIDGSSNVSMSAADGKTCTEGLGL